MRIPAVVAIDFLAVAFSAQDHVRPHRLNREVNGGEIQVLPTETHGSGALEPGYSALVRS